MLKNIFNKNIKQGKKQSENISNLVDSISDGFLEIKGFKEIDGKKELVYYNAGDNTVTDWMRHAIMILLTGSSFTREGDMPNTNHTTIKNTDGYILNGRQYLWNNDDKNAQLSTSTISANHYAVFPTKILFGTGKEYSSWAALQSENQSENVAWYTNVLNEYGGDVSTAQLMFENGISSSENKISGSVANNIYTAENVSIIKTRTVNDPDPSSKISTTSSMSKNFNVVGAIKNGTYTGDEDDGKLMSTISESGRLLQPAYRGVGSASFIYFNRPKGEEGSTNPEWVNENNALDVYLSKDSSKNYLNKITFHVKMPSQSAAEGSVGKYYPYNGYTLKQVGLYNDARLSTVPVPQSNEKIKTAYNNMPGGTLLAVKNIDPITKSADISLEVTWTLTI